MSCEDLITSKLNMHDQIALIGMCPHHIYKSVNLRFNLDTKRACVFTLCAYSLLYVELNFISPGRVFVKLHFCQ